MVNGKYRMPGSKSSHLLFTVYALDLVVILRTNGTKNLVLVFDLSIHDSRLTVPLTTVDTEGETTQRKPGSFCGFKNPSLLTPHSSRLTPLPFPFTVHRSRP